MTALLNKLDKAEQADILSGMLADLRKEAGIDVEKAAFRIPAAWIYRGIMALAIFASNAGIAVLIYLFPTKTEINEKFVSKEAFTESAKAIAENQHTIQSINLMLERFNSKLEVDARQDKRIDEIEAAETRNLDEVKRRVERLEDEKK